MASGRRSSSASGATTARTTRSTCTTGRADATWWRPGSTSSHPNLDTIVLRSVSMRIADLLERQRPVFSFEFFPPKTDEGQQTLRNTLEVLKDDEPDYVSVTYGAGGTTRNRTVEIT